MSLIVAPLTLFYLHFRLRDLIDNNIDENHSQQYPQILGSNMYAVEINKHPP